MTNYYAEYDNNERYEKLDEGVYLDLETEETVFIPSPNQRKMWRENNVESD